jgi:DNA-binding transcriptional LysR family regulator
MSLSSLQLDAFVAVAKTQNFSKAADLLFITQSALSQRIKNLEITIGANLFIREPSGIRITEIGERLLKYCQVKDALEQELLFNLMPHEDGELAGLVRIGVFSSVLPSAIIPALGELLRQNQKIQCDFIHREVQGLPLLLERGEVDFIVLDSVLNIASIEQHILGFEEYRVIESSKFDTPEDVYLDNSPEDPATEHYFSHLGLEVPNYRRLYMGETYGILAGVEQGLGRAVMPVHLITEDRGVRIVEGFSAYRRPIVLHFPKQKYYPQLHKSVIEELARECPKFLKSSAEN